MTSISGISSNVVSGVRGYTCNIHLYLVGIAAIGALYFLNKKKGHFFMSRPINFSSSSANELYNPEKEPKGCRGKFLDTCKKMQETFLSCFASPDIRQEQRAQILLLEEQIKVKGKQIEDFREFMNARPTLLAQYSEAYTKFQPWEVAMQELPKSKESDSLADQLYCLRIQLLNCENMIQNIERMLNENPDLVEAIKSQLDEQPLQLMDTHV